MTHDRRAGEPASSSGTVVSLQHAPLGVELTFVRLEGNPPLCRRLSALGFRRGAPVSVVQRASGGGRIVSVAGSRIALAASVLEHAFAQQESEH